MGHRSKHSASPVAFPHSFTVNNTTLNGVTVNTFETITIWDRAIDLTKTDLANFISSRDMKHIVTREGKSPTVYVLRDIPNGVAVSHLMNETGEDVQRMRAFQMSLVAIKNAKLNDGREVPEWRPRAVAESEGGLLAKMPLLVSQQEIDELFNLGDVLDIGEVARARCFLPREINDGFLLPPSSRQVLAASVQHFAAAVENTRKAGKSANETAQETRNSVAADAEPGDAHATA